MKWIITVVSMVLAGALPVFAQVQEILTDQAEEIMNRDEAAIIPDEVCEERQDLAMSPVDLNRATREELLETGLFTSFQVQMIIEYRDRYGDLLSINELASVPGFRIPGLKEIMPYVTVVSTPRTGYQGSPGTRILLFTGRAFPDASGYATLEQGDEPPVYTGSPWKNSLRVKSGLGSRISFGLAYEKDPGEKGFRRYRPEYMTGYLRFQGNRILEQAILGSYRIHSGMGLVQGSGFFHSPRGMHSFPILLSSLKPYAGISESGLHRGLALKLHLSPFTVTTWASLLPMDLSLGRFQQEPGDIDWVSYCSESGLHRTPAERSGRSLGYMANAGIHAILSYKRVFIGAVISTEFSGLTGSGKDSLQTGHKPNTYFSPGIHWRWQLGRVETYGEYVPGNRASTAILAGIRLHVNDFLAGGLQLHYYGPLHRETFSSAYASGSHISNEKGLMLHLRSEPAGSLMAGLSVELFGYPSSRYLALVPSSGFRFNCSLQNTGQGRFTWRVRIMKKIWQETPTGDEPGICSIDQKQLTRFDARMVLKPAGTFQWQSRLVASFISESRPVPGYAAIHQAGAVLHDMLKCTVQFVVFNISRWDNRIYLYEPGLYHQFSFPFFYGKGQKITLVSALKPGKRIILEGKLSMLTYHDRDQIGSGSEMVEGCRKFGTGFQIVVKL